MAGLLPYVLLSAGFASVLALCTLLALRVRRRGTGGDGIAAAMAAYNEAFRVTAYEAHQEITAQAERKAPLLSPDDLGERRESLYRAGRPDAVRSRGRRRGAGGLLRRMRRGH